MPSRRIGIMLELVWPYRRHLDVFAGTQEYAREVGHWDCRLDEFIGHVSSERAESLAHYDGIVARATPELADRAARSGVPLVNVWYNSPVRDRLPGVFADFAEVGRLAGEHVVARGFRRFACLSAPDEAAQAKMIDAFQGVVTEHGPCLGARCPRRYYAGGRAWQRFQATLDKWIADWPPPIAVFVAFSDVTARYVVNACRERGLGIPEDVALFTATDEPTVAMLPPPSLTSVDLDYVRIGHRAAATLETLMDGNEPDDRHTLVQPVGVVARSSTDFFAVEDESVAAAMRFIDRRAAEPIGVRDVADAVNVALRTLQRRFHEHTGRSISSEIRRLRVLRAKRLLLETDLLVKQVALQSGFRDSVRMHEVFVRDVGLTPSEFRTSG